MTADAAAESDALHERALGFVRAFEEGRPMPEAFDALACDLARFQAAHIGGFARLCRTRGVIPHDLARADQIPAVPTDAFKLTRVAWFPESEAKATFLTSGTTLGSHGRHLMRRPETYDAAAIAFGRWALSSDLPSRPRVLALSPLADDAPFSSLSRMMSRFVEVLGEPDPRTASFVRDGVLDLAELDTRVAEASVRAQPVLLLATSFALVHLLDGLEDCAFRLPSRSRVMQTGGFKGRSREVAPDVLRRELARTFGLGEDAIVGEYGMTELSSQLYEATLHGGDAGVYIEPPWARVTPVHPETLEPLAHGEIGIARITDLINVDSAVVVLAADRVRRKGAGVEVLGRAPGAPPRGCSLAIDDLLGAARPS